MTINFQNPNSEDWQDGGTFGHIARLSGMPLQEWNSLAPHIPGWPHRQSLLKYLLQKSGRSVSHLYFFEDSVLQLYEKTIAFRHFTITTRATGERIKGQNEVVDPSAGRSADEVRSICVLLEALVYKSIHIRLESQSPSYRERTEPYEVRMDRLVDAGFLDSRLRQLGQELYSTRCEFAHSIKSIDDLSYLGEPLKDRWGSRGTMKTRTFQRYFLPDAYQYSEALLGVFKPVQALQFDSSMFRDALLERLTHPDWR